jgi:hypothetical protein
VAKIIGTRNQAMLLRNLSRHPSTESGSSFGFSLARTHSGKPDDDTFTCGDGPPAPAEIFLEMGFVVAAALGLAVIVGLAPL